METLISAHTVRRRLPPLDLRIPTLALDYRDRVRRLAVLAASTAALVATTAAHANGRFPTASQLVIRPGHPEQMALRTTFGVLVSSDRAATWSFICEAAVGYQSSEIRAERDRWRRVAREHRRRSRCLAGRLLVGLRIGWLSRTRWSSTAPCARARRARRSSSPPHRRRRRTPALLSKTSSSSRRTTTDRTGRRSAPRSTRASCRRRSVASVAASDPHRLYVTTTRGAQPNATASLFVSTDDGAHWTERAIPLSTRRLERGAHIAGGRSDTRRLRLCTHVEGAGKSRLFVTDDAGVQFRAVYSGGPMLGFALSSDGVTVYLGGPEDGLQAAFFRATSSSRSARRSRSDASPSTAHGFTRASCRAACSWRRPTTGRRSRRSSVSPTFVDRSAAPSIGHRRMRRRLDGAQRTLRHRRLRRRRRRRGRSSHAAGLLEEDVVTARRRRR